MSQAPLDILLGYLMTDSNFLPINTLIMATKYYIFTCAVKEKTPSFNVLRLKLVNCYQEQLLLSCEKNKEKQFQRNWIVFKKMFEPETLNQSHFWKQLSVLKEYLSGKQKYLVSLFLFLVIFFCFVFCCCCYYFSFFSFVSFSYLLSSFYMYWCT